MRIWCEINKLGWKSGIIAGREITEVALSALAGICFDDGVKVAHWRKSSRSFAHILEKHRRNLGGIQIKAG